MQTTLDREAVVPLVEQPTRLGIPVIRLGGRNFVLSSDAQELPLEKQALLEASSEIDVVDPETLPLHVLERLNECAKRPLGRYRRYD